MRIHLAYPKLSFFMKITEWEEVGFFCRCASPGEQILGLWFQWKSIYEKPFFASCSHTGYDSGPSPFSPFSIIAVIPLNVAAGRQIVGRAVQKPNTVAHFIADSSHSRHSTHQFHPIQTFQPKKTGQSQSKIRRNQTLHRTNSEQPMGENRRTILSTQNLSQNDPKS